MSIINAFTYAVAVLGCLGMAVTAAFIVAAAAEQAGRACKVIWERWTR
jgi:hypothetical protein